MKNITDKCQLLSIQIIDRSIKRTDGTIDKYSKKFLEVAFNGPARELIREVVIIRVENRDEKCFCISNNDGSGMYRFEVVQ